jgi:FdhD protein
MPESSNQQTNKVTYVKGNRQVTRDLVIAEQPLQICISSSEIITEQGAILEKLHSSIFSITMRTPGHDEQLILGLLLSEGIISSINDIENISIEAIEIENTELASEETPNLMNENSWEVKLAKGVSLNIMPLERYQMTYSSCGLCGTTSLKSLELKSPPKSPSAKAWLNANKIGHWPMIMKKQQTLFNKTGGAHAAALFDQFGNLLDIKEDIGRHNAVDKLLGEFVKTNMNVDTDKNLAIVISSRISFEIVQKTIMAGIGVLIAVGAVSNLAISAAKRFDLTLIGFTTAESFNLYNGEWRMMPPSEDS